MFIKIKFVLLINNFLKFTFVFFNNKFLSIFEKKEYKSNILRELNVYIL